MTARKIILSFVGLALSVSCSYRKISGGNLSEAGQTGQGKPTAIAFDEVNKNVIGPKCLKCHSSAGGDQGGVNLETYANVYSQRVVVRSEVDTGDMPIRDTLSSTQKMLLLNWIDAGANEFASEEPSPEGPSTDPTIPVSTPVVIVPPSTMSPELSFQNVTAAVFAPACLKCHSTATSTKGGINLDNYSDSLAAKDTIRNEVVTGSMPLRGKLSDEQIQLVAMWVDAGAPELAPANPPIVVTPPPVVSSPVVVAPPVSSPVVVTPPPTVDPLTFENVNNLVITPSCVKCHSNAGGNRGNVNLETYQNVLSFKDTIKSEVVSGSMPIRSKLSADLIQLVSDWVDAGAPEKSAPVIITTVPVSISIQ